MIIIYAIFMSLISVVWFILFGVPKYVKATSSQEDGKYKDKKAYIYDFSYIWWLRNLLVRCPIINNKDRRKCTEERLAQTVYLPKTSHLLLSIGKVADIVLGVKTTKCK